MCLIGWWLTAAAAHQGRRPLLMWQQDPLAPDANGSEVSISVVDMYLLWVRCSLHSFPVFLSFSGSCLNTNSCSGLLSSLVLMISCCRASSSRAELTMKIRHGTNPSLVKLKDSKSFLTSVCDPTGVSSLRRGAWPARWSLCTSCGLTGGEFSLKPLLWKFFWKLF